MNSLSDGSSQLRSDPPAQNLREYGIRLEDVYCRRPHGERRDRRDEDPAEQDIQVSVSRSALSEDRRSFGVRVRVQGFVPLPTEPEIATLDIVIQGDFASDDPVDPELFEQFTNSTPLVMLWPFARSYFSDVARLMGVVLPLLPTLDASQPASEETASTDMPSG